jgi:hypothetical protein
MKSHFDLDPHDVVLMSGRRGGLTPSKGFAPTQIVKSYTTPINRLERNPLTAQTPSQHQAGAQSQRLAVDCIQPHERKSP